MAKRFKRVTIAKYSNLRVIHEQTIAGFDIGIYRHMELGERYMVVYGSSLLSCLTYGEACTEYGKAVMHAMQVLDGRVID